MYELATEIRMFYGGTIEGWLQAIWCKKKRKEIMSALKESIEYCTADEKAERAARLYRKLKEV